MPKLTAKPILSEALYQWLLDQAHARRVSQARIVLEALEAMREAEDAANRVLGGESTVRLSPQRSYVRRLQHLLGHRYSVASVSQGREPERAVMFYKP